MQGADSDPLGDRDDTQQHYEMYDPSVNKATHLYLQPETTSPSSQSVMGGLVRDMGRLGSELATLRRRIVMHNSPGAGGVVLDSSGRGCHTGAVTDTTPTVSIGTENHKRLFQTPVQTQQPPSLNVAYTMTASQMTSKTGYAGSAVSPDLGLHNAQYNAAMDRIAHRAGLPDVHPPPVSSEYGGYMSTPLGIEQKNSPSYDGPSSAPQTTEGAPMGTDKRPRENVLDPSLTSDESPKKIQRTSPSNVIPPFTGLNEFSEFLGEVGKKICDSGARALVNVDIVPDSDKTTVNLLVDTMDNALCRIKPLSSYFWDRNIPISNEPKYVDLLDEQWSKFYNALLNVVTCFPSSVNNTVLDSWLYNTPPSGQNLQKQPESKAVLNTNVGKPITSGYNSPHPSVQETFLPRTPQQYTVGVATVNPPVRRKIFSEKITPVEQPPPPRAPLKNIRRQSDPVMPSQPITKPGIRPRLIAPSSFQYSGRDLSLPESQQTQLPWIDSSMPPNAQIPRGTQDGSPILSQAVSDQAFREYYSLGDLQVPGDNPTPVRQNPEEDYSHLQPVTPEIGDDSRTVLPPTLSQGGSLSDPGVSRHRKRSYGNVKAMTPLPPSLGSITPSGPKGPVVGRVKVVHQTNKYKSRASPENFDGTGDFETWYDMFIKYREAGQWDDNVTIDKLLNCLKDEAATVALDLPPEEMTNLAAIVNNLVTYYRGEDTSAVSLDQFYKLTLAECKHNCVDFLNKLIRLYKRSSPETSDAAIENIIRYQFISRLPSALQQQCRWHNLPLKELAKKCNQNWSIMHTPVQQNNPIVQQTAVQPILQPPVQTTVQSMLQPSVQPVLNTQTWPTKSPVENFSNPIQGPIPAGSMPPVQVIGGDVMPSTIQDLGYPSAPLALKGPESLQVQQDDNTFWHSYVPGHTFTYNDIKEIVVKWLSEEGVDGLKARPAVTKAVSGYHDSNPKPAQKPPRICSYCNLQGHTDQSCFRKICQTIYDDSIKDLEHCINKIHSDSKESSVLLNSISQFLKEKHGFQVPPSTNNGTGGSTNPALNP